jgi:tRNA (guanine37-N1)-methyltransferase
VVVNSEIVKQISQSEFAKNKFDEIILISGRYAGIDQRFIDSYVHAELSIGDYVLSGGELPALVLIEAVTRFIPGVLGQLESAKNDSFENNLLEAPQYTKPAVWNGLEVPEVLLSGNHKKIADWKKAESVAVTLKKRPDLLGPEILKGKNNET